MGEKQAETDKRIDEHKQELAGKQKNIYSFIFLKSLLVQIIWNFW